MRTTKQIIQEMEDFQDKADRKTWLLHRREIITWAIVGLLGAIMLIILLSGIAYMIWG